MTEVLRPSLETAPGFTCKARLNDCSRSEHTSAPCLVQAVVRRRGAIELGLMQCRQDDPPCAYGHSYELIPPTVP